MIGKQNELKYQRNKATRRLPSFSRGIQANVPFSIPDLCRNTDTIR
ncbi:MAG: hypothetical protein LBH00_11730 [Planctomycetaceae bacterium]|nr:hypothetical protein [Planctomycetaceae bacterium]